MEHLFWLLYNMRCRTQIAHANDNNAPEAWWKEVPCQVQDPEESMQKWCVSCALFSVQMEFVGCLQQILWEREPSSYANDRYQSGSWWSCMPYSVSNSTVHAERMPSQLQAFQMERLGSLLQDLWNWYAVPIPYGSCRSRPRRQEMPCTKAIAAVLHQYLPCGLSDVQVELVYKVLEELWPRNQETGKKSADQSSSRW